MAKAKIATTTTAAAVDPQKEKVYKSVVSEIQKFYVDAEFNVNSDTNFEILSTIRYDPLLSPDSESLDTKSQQLFFLFEEHYERINFSLDYFKFGFNISKDELLLRLYETIKDLSKLHPYKLRLTISHDGDCNITAFLVPQRFNLFDGFSSLESYTDPLWKVYIDTKPILISPFTSFKTTRRDLYNASRERTLVPNVTEPQEVLLYNTANQVTEGSITNIAFKDPKDKDSWITPPLASGCLCGVVRHLLLSKKLMSERQVNLKDVNIGDEVLLFNGIVGVVKGEITENPKIDI